MAFSYYTVYRLESPNLPPFPALTGASQLEGNEWVFFSSENDQPPTRFFRFKSMKPQGGGVVDVVTEQGQRASFVPLTPAYVREHGDQFELNPAEVKAIKRESDLYTFFVSIGIPEWYVELFGPPEEQFDFESDYEDEALVIEEVDDRLQEKRGVKAAVGDIHIWKDGNAYQKGADGGWRRVESEWEDDDATGDLPKDTSERYWSKKTGWDEERRELHEGLIAPMFKDKEPVPAGVQPIFSLVMGAPAAGKTSFVQGDPTFGEAVVLDPDVILEGLPEFQTAMQKKVRAAAKVVHKEAGMVNDLALQKALEGRYHTIVPGSGSDLNWIQNDLFPRLVKAGYSINIVMPFVEDLDELLLRSEARGERSGRFVPTDTIIDLYDRLPKNFLALMDDPRVASASVTRTDRGGEEGRRSRPSEVFLRVRDATGEQSDFVQDPDSWEAFQKVSSKEESMSEAKPKQIQMSAAQRGVFDQVQKLLAADLKRMDKGTRKFKPGSGAVDLLPGRLTLPYDPR